MVLTQTIKRYGRVDLLHIEIGYMELDRRGAELLFQVFTEREEHTSIAIASDESFSGWTRVIGPRPCAIVDRLAYHATSSRPAPTPTGSRAPSAETAPPSNKAEPDGDRPAAGAGEGPSVGASI